jgi:phenol 2-monooxygenase (NADPH)
MALYLLRSGRIEQFFLDDIEEHSDIRVERDTQFESFVLDEAEVDKDHAYPITVHLSERGNPLTIKTKYLVGCEGARSLMRDQLGIRMEGRTRQSVYGVLGVYRIFQDRLLAIH